MRYFSSFTTIIVLMYGFLVKPNLHTYVEKAERTLIRLLYFDWSINCIPHTTCNCKPLGSPLIHALPCVVPIQQNWLSCCSLSLFHPVWIFVGHDWTTLYGVPLMPPHAHWTLVHFYPFSVRSDCIIQDIASKNLIKMR